MNARIFTLTLALLLPGSALADGSPWEARLSDALIAGWTAHGDTWTDLQSQQPRATRAGHLRFTGPDFNHPDAVPLALERLAHGAESEDVRQALAELVARFSDDWGDALVELVAEEPSASVRSVLVMGLRNVEPTMAAAGFRLALLDPSGEVRMMAAMTAARRPDGLTVAPGLMDSLSDDAPAVRAAAANALGVLGATAAAAPMAALLSDSEPDVRLAALRALGRIDRSALSAPALRTLAGDSDKRVSRAAGKLLAR